MRAVSGVTFAGTAVDGFRRPTAPDQGYINHVALLLDESSSMQQRRGKLVEVVDAEIRNLAEQSRRLNQETRVTVYAFADDVRCLVYDRDVLRLPSVAAHYRPSGMTALLDATGKAIEDLEKTAQLYGDHAFLLYLFTDGMENRSRRFGPEGLRRRLDGLAENWTAAGFVPDQAGERYLRSFGFPAGNVARWDATTDAGVADGVAVMSAATTSFMTARASGVRGSKTLLAGGADQVNAQARKAAGLRVVPKSDYSLINVTEYSTDAGTPGVLEIRPFVEHYTRAPYRTGSAFYQLHTVLGGTKTAEKIQPQKKIMVRDRKSGRVYAGAAARQLLGLPDNVEVRVKPEDNPKYQIFVQSTSVNRKLVAGTKLLVTLGDPA